MSNVEHPSHYAAGRKYEPIDVIDSGLSINCWKKEEKREFIKSSNTLEVIY